VYLDRDLGGIGERWEMVMPGRCAVTGLPVTMAAEDTPCVIALQHRNQQIDIVRRPAVGKRELPSEIDSRDALDGDDGDAFPLQQLDYYVRVTLHQQVLRHGSPGQSFQLKPEGCLAESGIGQIELTQSSVQPEFATFPA
jgi:hypothetical protein